MGRFTFFIVFFILTVWATLSQAAQTYVQDIRIGGTPEKTRLVVEFSRPVQYTVFSLPNPNRVVIDLPPVQWKAAQNSENGGGMISGYRCGQFSPELARIVVDVKHPVNIEKPFFLKPMHGKGHRLVLDISPCDQSAFVAQCRRLLAARPKPKPQMVVRPVQPFAKPAPRSGDKITIVIDPGHGGIDPGAIGVNGVHEKSVTLATAKHLKRALERTGRFKVILTRSTDVFVQLRQRVAIARRHHAMLFVSLHADASANREARGASVYTLSDGSSDKEAAALAARENKADIIAGVDLSEQADEVTSILIDLAQRETKNLSAKFATTLIPCLGNVCGLKQNTHRFAGFAVLKAPDIPSVLVELGYLSNRHDVKQLCSDQHRSKLAQSIATAIGRYFSWKSQVGKA